MLKQTMLAAGLLMAAVTVQAGPNQGKCHLDELNLSAEQKVQVQQVVAANREQMKQLHRQMREQIKAVLTEEQQVQFMEQKEKRGKGLGKGMGADGEKSWKAGSMGGSRNGMGCNWMQESKGQSAEKGKK